MNCWALTALDLTPLAAARCKKIPENFLSYCCSLAALDLAPLAGVRAVGGSFLFACEALQALDLAPMVALRKIGDHFLEQCRSLRIPDLRPLRRLRRIPDGFLSECDSLEAADMTPLVSVAAIGRDCLGDSTSLRDLRVPPWSLERIGPNFCRSTGLVSADLGRVVVTWWIDSGFFAQCRNLVRIVPPAVRSVGDGFLFSCPRLRSVDLRAMRGTRDLGHGFLADCTSLEAPDVSLLAPSVRSVGEYFMRGSSWADRVARAAGAPQREEM